MKKFNYFEQIFTVISLLIYSQALLLLLLSGGANESEVEVDYDTSILQIVYIFIYLITFFLLILRWKKVVLVFQKNRLLWILLILTVSSILWSFLPDKTVKISFRLIGSSLFGIYLATRYTLKQQLQLLGLTFGIVIVLSFIFAVALPKYGIMGGVHAGSWRGIFLHKNSLGTRMVNSSITFLFLAVGSKKGSQLFWCAFGLSLLLLLLSFSTSSLLNLAILIAIFLALRTLWLPYRVMIPIIVAIVTIGQIIYFWFMYNADLIFGFLGKDSNLSGRGDLWSLVFDMIWKQPWLGYGFSGFWNGWNGESAYIWRAAPWTPTHPHNGFLAMWLDLGLLGLSIFLLGFGINYLRALILVRLNKTVEGIFPAIHMSFLVLANLTESSLMESDNINWILYVSLSCSVIMVLAKRKHEKLALA